MKNIKAGIAGSVLVLAAVVTGIGVVGAPATTVAQAQNTAPLTEADVKAFVTRQQERSATGIGSVHKSVTLTFESVRMGAPRPINYADQLEGMRGATIYPVQVKYQGLRRWGNGSTQTVETHYAYDFFRDEFGDWAAKGLGPVR